MREQNQIGYLNTNDSTIATGLHGAAIPTIDSTMMSKFRDFIFPFLVLLSRTKVQYKVQCLNSFKPLPDKPIIFAANHSDFRDMPIILNVTKRHSYILSGRQRLAVSEKIFFDLLGVVWVDRKSKPDMQAALKTLLHYLKKGRSVLWFPEGTWNLSENLLMLPIKWGIVRTAKTADAQIIPIALEYDREERICTVKFGVPIVPDGEPADDICVLRDALSTLRWELWERKGIYCRQNLNIDDCRYELYQAVRDYPPVQLEYEKTLIFSPHTSPEAAFEHLHHLIPCRENAFLLRGIDH